MGQQVHNKTNNWLVVELNNFTSYGKFKLGTTIKNIKVSFNSKKMKLAIDHNENLDVMIDYQISSYKP